MKNWIYRQPPRIVRKRNPNWRLLFTTLIIPIGLATEADSAFSVGIVGGQEDVGLAVETDISLAMIPALKVKDVGLSLEFDFSLDAQVVGGPIQVALSQETSTSLPAFPDKGYDTGLPTEASTSFAIQPLRTLDALKAIETDSSLNVTVALVPSIGLPLDVGVALAITPVKSFPLAVVVEVDVSQEVFFLGQVFIGQPIEVDTALPAIPVSLGQVGLSIEIDSAFSVVPLRSTLIGLPTTADTAFSVTIDLVLVPQDLGWEDDDVTWGGIELGSKDFAPVFLDGQTFQILGFDAVNPLDAFVERRAVVSERGSSILGLAVWPEILGPTGQAVQIWLGGHETPAGSVDWEGPYDFIIGQDHFVDFAVAGKYLAVRFESSGIPVWTLQSFDIHYEIVGRH